jgi:hypothetical protein
MAIEYLRISFYYGKISTFIKNHQDRFVVSRIPLTN